MNKERKNQLEEKRSIETDELLRNFEEDCKLTRATNEQIMEMELKQKEERRRKFLNEQNVRNQIIQKEIEAEEALKLQKYKDKDQIDEIVNKIIQEEVQSKTRVAENKKQQFGNMVESLWLKKQNLKQQKELEQQEFQKAVDFQKILDARETEKLQKQQAANEFKDKVYAQIES